MINLFPNQELQNQLESCKLKAETLRIRKDVLVKCFGRNSGRKAVCEAIARYLTNGEYDFQPKDLYHHGRFSDVVIRAKRPKAQRKKSELKVARTLESLLPLTKSEPKCVESDKPLSVALSMMALNDYSQLPIVEPGTKSLCGYISWRTISETLIGERPLNTVMDYGFKDYESLSVSVNKPLIEAAKMIGSTEFLLVTDKQNQIKGIVTMFDLTDQYIRQTEPFLILEEIEDCIRNLIAGKFSNDEIISVCKLKPSPTPIEEMTFGQYVKLLSHNSGTEKYFDRLHLTNIDRDLFLQKMGEVREVRNAVMHFKPELITEDKMEMLHSAVKFFRLIGTK